MPELYRVIESPSGPLLVYQWLDGELLGAPRAKRDDPESAFQRFRSLPAATIQVSLDAIFDLHHELAGAGWIAVDFSDGTLNADAFRGTSALFEVVARACELERSRRYDSMAAFYNESKKESGWCPPSAAELHGWRTYHDGT